MCVNFFMTALFNWWFLAASRPPFILLHVPFSTTVAIFYVIAAQPAAMKLLMVKIIECTFNRCRMA